VPANPPRPKFPFDALDFAPAPGLDNSAASQYRAILTQPAKHQALGGVKNTKSVLRHKLSHASVIPPIHPPTPSGPGEGRKGGRGHAAAAATHVMGAAPPRKKKSSFIFCFGMLMPSDACLGHVKTCRARDLTPAWPGPSSSAGLASSVDGFGLVPRFAPVQVGAEPVLSLDTPQQTCVFYSALFVRTGGPGVESKRGWKEMPKNAICIVVARVCNVLHHLHHGISKHQGE